MKLGGQLGHLLCAGEEPLPFRNIAYLFLGGPLRHRRDLVQLVLRLRNRVLLDTCVIVLVDTSKICGKFLIEDVRSQVLLALDELQIF